MNVKYFHLFIKDFLMPVIVVILTMNSGAQVIEPGAIEAGSINPSKYPAADEKEWGQLLWNLQLAGQDIADFTNYSKVDDQGISACRYTLAFSAYFMALEQYHKFPAWQEVIRPAFDRLVQKMLRKEVWGYWSHESMGITKFEPDMDRPYPQNNDPVSLGNIMYSGHLGMMINLYQMLYHDMKWDQPGSIVFEYEPGIRFVYDNRSLQEVMLLQMLYNPVPGIECERNAIFPACNTHPMISWKIYDKTHNSRYFEGAHPVFDPWFEKVFINPQTNDLASFYLIKQGWAFSGWNPKYGNKMDKVMEEMVKKGVDFNSGGNDGWIGTFMHAWNPKLIDNLYPSLKKKHYKFEKGIATLTKDVVALDAYYGFFTALAAEVGDESARKALIKTVDSLYSPVWIGNTYHYPFMDNVPTVNLAAADGEKTTPPSPATQPTTIIRTRPVVAPSNETKSDAAAPASSTSQAVEQSGLCCKSTQIKGHGDACNMKSFPSHSDLADRLIAIARALPANGLNTMVNKPFDDQHFNEPSIAGVDLNKVILKRAIWDRNKKMLMVSTLPKKNAGITTIAVNNLDPSKTYTISTDEKTIPAIKGQQNTTLSFDAGKAHEIQISQQK